MLSTHKFDPYTLKPTHHLDPETYFGLEKELIETGKSDFADPIVVFGEKKLIYDGHHRTAITCNKHRTTIYGYHVLSQEDFLKLPQKHWHAEFTPETHTFEETYRALQQHVLADDEVFNL